MPSNTKIIHAKPTLTLFADASLRNDKAGWGGWARGDDREPVFFSGPAEPHSSIDVIELQALAETLTAIHESGYLEAGDQSILLQSDSLCALQALNRCLPNSWASTRSTGARIYRAKQAPDSDRKRFIDQIEGFIGDRGVVYLRHVYAHRKGDTARSWVNEKCDQLAKAAAR